MAIRNNMARPLRMLGLIWCVGLATGCPAALAQLDDPLPDVQLGGTAVRLRAVARNLPVESEFVTPVFTQRVGPTDLVEIPDGSGDLLVTTYGGTAFRIDRQGTGNPQRFLDLRAPSSDTFNPQFEIGDAHGLTSLVFHPHYRDASMPGYGRFYTIEAETSGSGVADFTRSVISGDHHQEAIYEYQMSDPLGARCDTTCASSKRELLRVTQPGWHHNLGDMVFGGDGFMYIGSGDGNVAGTQGPLMSDNSLALDNIFGKVLRIDPLGSSSDNGQYGVPLDNPFVDGPGGRVDEIYAYGLRNPYRLDYDATTDTLFSSETGELEIESIERVVPGGNHGWNLKEGSFLYDRTTKQIAWDTDQDGDGRGDLAAQLNLQEPIFEYDHGDGRAVVGGAVSRDAAVPQLNGMYVFGEFVGKIFYGDPATGQMFRLPLSGPSVDEPYNIHSVNKDAEGGIYILGIENIGGGEFGGVVLRVMSPLIGDGDFDNNGVADVTDLNQLTIAIRNVRLDERFDLDGDQKVDAADRQIWINEIGLTRAGDADFDGRFTSDDLLVVLQAGEYEDEPLLNSLWQTGDWDGDGEFDSADLVLSLVSGGYEAQDLPATLSVPEPSTRCLSLIAVSIVSLIRRRAAFRAVRSF